MANLYRIRTAFTGALVTGGGVNNLYFQEAAGEGVDAQSAVADFWSDMAEDISVYVEWTVEPSIAVIDVATGAIVDEIQGTTHLSGGTQTGDPLPPVIQGLAQWRSDLFVAGRRLRGRTFLPGMVESNSSGSPTAALQGRVEERMATLAGAADTQLHVWSKTHGVSSLVTGWTMWGKFAELRSRRD